MPGLLGLNTSCECRFEHLSDVSEVVHSLLDLGKAISDKALNVPAEAGFVVAMVQEGFDVNKGKSGALSNPDEPELLPRSLAVETVVSLAPGVSFEQPGSLVIPNRRGRNPGGTGQLTDGVASLHASELTRTLH